jgi:hypothetical protein
LYLLQNSFLTHSNRLLRFQRGKTNSSVTNFENLLPLTVPFVTTRTRLARTAARLDTANTIVPSDKTLQLASFAEFAVMQVTLLASVLIAREVRTGEMMVHALLAEEELAMPLIVKWRYVHLWI